MTTKTTAAPPSAPTSAWRNRIVGSGEEAPDQLVANPATGGPIRVPDATPSAPSMTAARSRRLSGFRRSSVPVGLAVFTSMPSLSRVAPNPEVRPR